ncbi:MAG: DUF454 domain-containing protein [Porphyromonadaceae bacterium]|nr:DUF454 domain-containing protein [Porphyromonadaceae bacterium]
MKKYLLIISGSLSVVLGVIGIFLPILPTTPFMILAAALYAKSSKRLHSWIINHRIFGEFIRNFKEDRSMSLNGKLISIITMWVFMLYSIFFVVNHKLYLQLILGGLALGETIFILSLKTKRKKDSQIIESGRQQKKDR